MGGLPAMENKGMIIRKTLKKAVLGFFINTKNSVSSAEAGKYWLWNFCIQKNKTNFPHTKIPGGAKFGFCIFSFFELKYLKYFNSAFHKTLLTKISKGRIPFVMVFNNYAWYVSTGTPEFKIKGGNGI